MLHMSRTRWPHRPRRRQEVDRPLLTPDNPVRRYLGNRSVGPGLWKRPSPWGSGSVMLRPA